MFNATVILYVLELGIAGPSFPAPSALTRLNTAYTSLLDTHYVSIQPRSDWLVLFSPPLVFHFEDFVAIQLIRRARMRTGDYGNTVIF